MKAIRLIVVAGMVAMLSGCFMTTGGSRHGYGSSENATILGGGGAILGAALTRSNPAVGAVVGGVAGYVVGSSWDRHDAQVGQTSCRSTLSRTYNRDGTIAYVSQNNETCRSTFQTPGYRAGFNR